MTIILISIVIVFFVCHTPRNIMNWYEFINIETLIFCRLTHKKSFEPPYSLHFLYMFGELTIILNSTLNFFVYCFVGPKFRRQLLQIFGIKKLTPELVYVSIVTDA